MIKPSNNLAELTPFCLRFAREWLIHYVLMIIIYGSFISIVVVSSVKTWIGFIFYVPEVFLISALLFSFVYAFISIIIAPKALAHVAHKLIQYYGLEFYLFTAPQVEFERTKWYPEYLHHRYVLNLRAARNYTGCIWRLSEHRRDYLVLDKARFHEKRLLDPPPDWIDGVNHNLAPGSSFLLPQWFSYSAILLAGFVGLGNVSDVVSGVSWGFAPLFVFPFIFRVHSLAFAAAYFRVLTEHWPWEVGFMMDVAAQKQKK